MEGSISIQWVEAPTYQLCAVHLLFEFMFILIYENLLLAEANLLYIFVRTVETQWMV